MYPSPLPLLDNMLYLHRYAEMVQKQTHCNEHFPKPKTQTRLQEDSVFLFIYPKINPQFLNLSVEISIMLSRNARQFPTPGMAYSSNKT